MRRGRRPRPSSSPSRARLNERLAQLGHERRSRLRVRRPTSGSCLRSLGGIDTCRLDRTKCLIESRATLRLRPATATFDRPLPWLVADPDQGRGRQVLGRSVQVEQLLHESHRLRAAPCLSAKAGTRDRDGVGPTAILGLGEAVRRRDNIALPDEQDWQAGRASGVAVGRGASCRDCQSSSPMISAREALPSRVSLRSRP